MQNFDPNAAALPNSGVYGLPSQFEDSRVILMPVPYEATTSYGGGTANGPAAILAASKQVDLYDYVLGRPYKFGIYLLPEDERICQHNHTAKALAQEVIEQGGNTTDNSGLLLKLNQVNESSALVNEIVYNQAKTMLAQHKIFGVIGGDHSVSFGSIMAHAEAYPCLGILHLDAHCDLRPAYEGFTWSHASIMYNAINRISSLEKIVQVGIRDFSEQEFTFITESQGRIVTYFDEALAIRRFNGQGWIQLCKEMIEHLPQQVYLSFDIDGLDPRLCPHTGTPVPGGLSFREVVALITVLVESGRQIIGFDLTEVAPHPNGEDEWDANVGARLLYKMIGYTLLSQGAKA
jgi:agmatinase